MLKGWPGKCLMTAGDVRNWTSGTVHLLGEFSLPVRLKHTTTHWQHCIKTRNRTRQAASIQFCVGPLQTERREVANVQAKKAYGGKRGMAPLIRNFSTRLGRGVSGKRHPPLPLLRKTRKNILPPPDSPARDVVTTVTELSR